MDVTACCITASTTNVKLREEYVCICLGTTSAYQTSATSSHRRNLQALSRSLALNIMRWVNLYEVCAQAQCNTSSTSNKVDTANDKCTFAGKLADGNYVWSVTENGTTVASGSFTLDRGV